MPRSPLSAARSTRGWRPGPDPGSAPARLPAEPAERREVHRVLAAVTDPVLDPDRRAWHAAQAADGADEEAAAALYSAAGRARQRGGVAAEAVLLERATELTPDPWQRGRRAL